MLVEGAPQWYPRSGNYFLSQGLINPRIVFPVGKSERLEFPNTDNESQSFTLTALAPPSSHMPMTSGGGMMGVGGGSGCWLPVRAMVVKGTTASGAEPVCSASAVAVEVAEPTALRYVRVRLGHTQSGMYGVLAVGG